MFAQELLEAHGYAMVDCYMLGDELPPTWKLLPLVPDGLEADAAKFPALLPLASLPDEEFFALCEQLEHARAHKVTPPILSLFKTSADAKHLQAHWKKQLIARLPGGGKFHLRSYAPRVMTQILRIYSPPQLKALFGCISEWSIYCDHEWHRLQAPACEPVLAQFFSRPQGEQMHRIQAINRTLAQLPDELRPAYASDAKGYFSVSEKIDSLLLRAANHALAREDEQVQFALHGMTVHPHFDTHPRVRALLAGIDRNEQTYLDAIAELQPADWQRIATDLNAQQHTQYLMDKAP
ncbi:DUF4123 domain-containing protein [Pseudoduganella sp. R-43]|uniref:DUF4123 domain-containing protein n=1 Tax=unclassified Pseudoduganella TaxID=2637179 RepID=UPI003CE92466